MTKSITEVIESRHISGTGQIQPQNDKIHYGSDRFGTYVRHGTDGGPGMTKSITEVIDSKHMSAMGRMEPQNDNIHYGND